MSSGSVRDWGDLRAFLAVAQAGSTLRAARTLGVNHTTLGRRIRSLEHDLGLTLFERDTRGFHLTPAGAALEPLATDIGAAVEALAAEAERRRRKTQDAIRLTGPQPIIDWIVQPVIAAFREQHPKVRFEYQATTEPVDMQAGQADVALRIANSVEGGDVMRRRLPPLQWAVCCSRDYAARVGAPGRIEEVGLHPVIGFTGRLAHTQAWRWFAERVAPEAIVALCDNHPNMRAILASGAGVGPLAHGAGDPAPELQCCFEPPEEMRVPFWLLVSPQARRRRIVGAFVRLATPRLVAMMRAQPAPAVQNG